MPKTKKITSVKDLVPDSRNANKGTVRGGEQLKRSIEQYGAGRSVLIDRNGRPIAGNKTAAAAAALGIEKVIVVPTDGNTVVAVQRLDLDLGDPKLRHKAQELAIADNRAAELNLEWDPDALAEIAKDCDLSGFFTSAELDNVIGADDAGDELSEVAIDKAAELQKKWGTARGQIWEAGPHRIMCGETGLKDVQRLMAGELANMVNTDPPYGVSYQSAATGSIANDDKRDDALLKMLAESLESMCQASVPAAAFYIWHATSTRRDFEEALDRVGLVEKQYITWVKDSFVLGHADYHWQTEPCFYAEKAGQHAPFYGKRDQSTVWRVSHRDESGDRIVSITGGLRLSNGHGVEVFIGAKAPKGKKLRLLRLGPAEVVRIAAEQKGSDAWSVSHDAQAEVLHPTQKPAGLAARAIENSSQAGEIVFDGFLGAGFSAIAAEKLGRRCFGIDIEPKWIAVVLERLSKMGRKPRLAHTAVKKAS